MQHFGILWGKKWWLIGVIEVNIYTMLLVVVCFSVVGVFVCCLCKNVFILALIPMIY